MKPPFYKQIFILLSAKYLFKFLTDIPVSADKASIDAGISFSAKKFFKFNWSQLSLGTQLGHTLFEVV